jgi:hypothetical protein
VDNETQFRFFPQPDEWGELVGDALGGDEGAAARLVDEWPRREAALEMWVSRVADTAIASGGAVAGELGVVGSYDPGSRVLTGAFGSATNYTGFALSSGNLVVLLRMPGGALVAVGVIRDPGNPVPPSWPSLIPAAGFPILETGPSPAMSAGSLYTLDAGNVLGLGSGAVVGTFGSSTGAVTIGGPGTTVFSGTRVPDRPVFAGGKLYTTGPGTGTDAAVVSGSGSTSFPIPQGLSAAGPNTVAHADGGTVFLMRNLITERTASRVLLSSIPAGNTTGATDHTLDGFLTLSVPNTSSVQLLGVRGGKLWVSENYSSTRKYMVWDTSSLSGTPQATITIPGNPATNDRTGAMVDANGDLWLRRGSGDEDANEIRIWRLQSTGAYTVHNLVTPGIRVGAARSIAAAPDGSILLGGAIRADEIDPGYPNDVWIPVVWRTDLTNTQVVWSCPIGRMSGATTNVGTYTARAFRVVDGKLVFWTTENAGTGNENYLWCIDLP